MGDQKRIILWCIPRSCSTAFARSILNLGNIKFLNEKYYKPFYAGEERRSKRYDSISPTFKNVIDFKGTTALYEEEYPNNDIVFGKEMAVFVEGLLDDWDNLPAGYQHTFLIRDPACAIPSLYKCLTDKDANDTDYFDTQEANYEPLSRLFNMVKEKQGETPLLIDTDDLLDDPEKIMKLYCERTGLKYSKKMLTWEPGPLEGTSWHKYPGWHGEVVNSTGFKRSNDLEDIFNLSEMGDDVKKCVKDNMKFYEDLKKYRIK